MSLTIGLETLLATTCAGLKDSRKFAQESYRPDREWEIDTAKLSDKDLADIKAAAGKADEPKIASALDAILAARKGEFGKPIPNFKAFRDTLRLFLKKNAVDGWIWVEQPDGRSYPELVQEITFDDGTRGHGRAEPKVTITTASYGFEHEGGERYAIAQNRKRHVFVPADVTRKRVADALAAKGIFKETPELKTTYVAEMKRHKELSKDAFGRQFRFGGRVLEHESEGWRRRGEKAINQRVVWDLNDEDFRSYQHHVDCEILKDGVGAVPEHAHVRVYDLEAHEFLWVGSADLTAYQYDKSLKDKLILPDTHRDLLDVLTEELQAFTGDFIEGKSTGNTILCKGLPGLGKTLSAEVYSEIVERPLVKIHSGRLGTAPQEIQENLQWHFRLAKRWNAVLLLDECDVFVMRRGNDPVLNAIVAEFLRALEYFDGLLFLTTNRPDDIDEAIIERCIAIIDYETPDEARLRRVWEVMSEQFKAGLTAKEIGELVALLPNLKPRDVKMLLSVTLKVAKARKRKATIDDFRHCAMFRGVRLAQAA